MLFKFKFDIEQTKMYFTFMEFSGATSISFHDQTLARCGRYYCLVCNQELKIRAISIPAFIRKMNKL